ncbi:MAG: GTP cyclohydrolase II [Deltaproteobacteria bacterium]|nr:GTP cyclohydrolase II [Deltaproteobacteria bacterium]
MTAAAVAMDALQALVVRDRDHECEGFGPARVCVRVVAVAQLPTRFGPFRLVGFWNNRDGKEHVAMVHGDVVDSENVPVRLHSECLTGDVMGSLRCDCRDQLTEGLRTIQREGRGILLYLRQEGRGIGLLNKIRAYALQEQGLDTVEANQALGFRDDERDYAVAAHMLRSLGVRSVRVVTNNPDKIRQLEQHGVKVSGRIPHVIPPNEWNRFYLETKARRSGHMLDLTAERLPEQSDLVVVEGMPR